MAESTGMGGGMTGITGIVSSVQNALTTLDPQAGASAIEQVLGVLTNVPGTESIAGTLNALHQQLAGGAPDGAHVGGLLRELSAQTRGASGQAGPMLGGGLSQLADRLESAASQVTSGGAA